MVGLTFKIVVLLVCVALAVLSWWAPFKLGGWGWLIPALAGPLMALMVVGAIVFPDDPQAKVCLRRKDRRKDDPWPVRFEKMAVVLAIIHGGLWFYFNWR